MASLPGPGGGLVQGRRQRHARQGEEDQREGARRQDHVRKTARRSLIALSILSRPGLRPSLADVPLGSEAREEHELWAIWTG